MKHTIVTLPKITFNHTFKNKIAARQAAIIAFINMLHDQEILKEIKVDQVQPRTSRPKK